MHELKLESSHRGSMEPQQEPNITISAIRNLNQDRTVAIASQKTAEELGQRCPKGLTPLHHVASVDYPALHTVLLEKMNDEDILAGEPITGRTCLVMAIRSSNDAFIDSLERIKPELFAVLSSMPDVNDITPLHYAVALKSKAAFRVYPHTTASVILADRDEHGRTIIHTAATNHNAAIIELLLQDPIIIEGLVGATDNYGQTALHLAASQGDADICRTLCRCMSADQISTQALDSLGTALHYCVQANSIDTAAAILNCSEKTQGLIDVCDASGKTAVQQAETHAKELSAFFQFLLHERLTRV